MPGLGWALCRDEAPLLPWGLLRTKSILHWGRRFWRSPILVVAGMSVSGRCLAGHDARSRESHSGVGMQEPRCGCRGAGRNRQHGAGPDRLSNRTWDEQWFGESWVRVAVPRPRLSANCATHYASGLEPSATSSGPTSRPDSQCSADRKSQVHCGSPQSSWGLNARGKHDDGHVHAALPGDFGDTKYVPSSTW